MKTVYQRIALAAKTRKSLKLSAIEIGQLAADETIRSRAEQDDLRDARGCADTWHEMDERERKSASCPTCKKSE